MNFLRTQASKLEVEAIIDLARSLAIEGVHDLRVQELLIEVSAAQGSLADLPDVQAILNSWYPDDFNYEYIND